MENVRHGLVLKPGVTQGSMPGPLTFLIYYIKDFSDDLTTQSAFSCSKLTETLEQQGLKYFQR